MSCFMASFSSVRFVMIRRIRVFSSSTARLRAISLLSMPPNLAFHAGVRINAVPAAKLYERCAGIMLPKNRDDLRLAESSFSPKGFLSAISAWKPTVSIGPVSRGNVIPEGPARSHPGELGLLAVAQASLLPARSSKPSLSRRGERATL